ncbi:unnamed protein product [Spirodela intermedia]|uniref:CDT1 Geminin-binding domain-containing protein n=1 Tax=Spirodela intermedia TaxID=51605 RepID=A0A7I8LML9_SPIIN|nr:unnamed protein product [Spirodela intermedia]
MDLVSSGRASERGKSSSSTPEKAFSPSAAAAAAAAAASSTTKSSISEEIVTPEKPAELPRRIRNRGVAFSVKEVRKVAASLQQPHGVSPNRTEKSRTLRSAEKDAAFGSIAESVQKRLPSKPVPRLTETCEILLEFFNSLTSSIRLLRLKGYLSSFSKISPQVESLTNRRFSHGHLAQLKYILPEAICIKKILTHDEPTSCIKPDLQVVLQIDAFEDGNEQKKRSGYHKLSQVFRSRLVEFSKEHPDGEDVPEAELPEPFNHTRGIILSPSPTDSIPVKTSRGDLPFVSSSQEQPATQVPSHIPGSFRRHFSRKDCLSGQENNLLTRFADGPSPATPPTTRSQSALPNSSPRPPISRSSSSPISTDTQLPPESSGKVQTSAEEPARTGDCPAKCVDDLEGTPVKLMSTPKMLMTATPQLQTPRRDQPGDGERSNALKSHRRPTRTKLFHTPVKRAIPQEEETEVADESVLHFLPKALLQSVREKEKRTREEQEAGMAASKRRRNMLSCLPRLFNTVLLLFQSAKCSVITRQELIHKIISSQCEIVDRREVEEQLGLLQELVPDWISGKTASSGDFLFCVNKTSDTEALRRRLAEAE